VGKRSRDIRARRAEHEREAKRALCIAKTAAERGCLFCRKAGEPFSSVEHVFAESLGNKDLILPKGIVCDSCNHEKLSVLDQGIVDFMPIAMRRTMLGVTNKEGRLRQLRLQGETIDHVPGVDGANPTLVVNSKTPGKSPIHEIARFPDGRVRLQMKGSGGRAMTSRYCSLLSRALLKSALECAWLDHGVAVLEEPFDHIRERVLGMPADGFFALMKTSPDPNGVTVSLAYDLVQESGVLRMPVYLTVYGVVMHTDSRLAEPKPEHREENWNVRTFTAHELGRTSPQ
jgi:hypothetical protein